MPLVLAQNEVNLSGHDYADVAGEVYEYPARYQNLIKPGEQFVYYRGKRRSGGAIETPEYFGTGIVGAVSKIGDRYSCTITNFSPFEVPVAFKNGSRYLEPGANQRVPGSYFRSGVRRLAQEQYGEICRAGRPPAANDHLYAEPTTALEVDELPAVQAPFGDSEVLGDLTQRGLTLPGDGDDVAAELLGERFRHGEHPSIVRSDPHRSDVNQTGGSPEPQPCGLGNNPTFRHGACSRDGRPVAATRKSGVH